MIGTLNKAQGSDKEGKNKTNLRGAEAVHVVQRAAILGERSKQWLQGGGGTTGAFAKKEVIEKRIHTIKEGQEYGVKI